MAGAVACLCGGRACLSCSVGLGSSGGDLASMLSRAFASLPRTPRRRDRRADGGTSRLTSSPSLAPVQSGHDPIWPAGVREGPVPDHPTKSLHDYMRSTQRCHAVLRTLTNRNLAFAHPRRRAELGARAPGGVRTGGIRACAFVRTRVRRARRTCSARRRGTARRSDGAALSMSRTRASLGSLRCDPRDAPTQRGAGNAWAVRGNGREQATESLASRR